MPSTTLPRIVLLAAPESSASILYGLYDVLLSVGPMWPDMIAGEGGDALLDVKIVAADPEPFRCFGGILVEPHAAIADVHAVDAVVVCDMYARIDTPPQGRFATELAWLRRMQAAGTLVASVCSGSLLLAEAGLLDGRSCTGHWAYRELFRWAYPKVRFSPEGILDLSSEEDGLITAGGVTSWQDLALHLIARFAGPEEAARTAKIHLLAGHQDGQLPFAAMSRWVRSDDRVVHECLAWIAENYAVPTPVTAMAERSGLSRRTFARRFLASTGQRPIDYVQALRIEGARELLETGTTAIDDVGFKVGYEDPTFFRRLFKRTTGMTPAAYRRKYQPIVATG